ncbi:MAG TPA: hypothetical protein VGF25_08005 [Thermoleophilaceae bacterium]|jgi:hypothetical protein
MKRCGDEAGAAGLVAAMALIVLAGAVLLGVRAFLPDALAARSVCQVRAVLALDARGACPRGEGVRPHPVRRATRPPRRGACCPRPRPLDPVRARLQQRLRMHERALNRFWRGVLGGRHERPIVRITPGFLWKGAPFVDGSHTSVDRKYRRRPVIDVWAGLRGDPARAFAAWLWVLAHEFGHNAQRDSGRALIDEPAYELQADCLAGAYIRWARDRRLFSPRTLRHIRDDIAARPPDPSHASGRERLESFLEGYGRTGVPDPLTRCGS